MPVHALPRLEGDLHGRRIGADGRRQGIGDGKEKGGKIIIVAAEVAPGEVREGSVMGRQEDSNKEGLDRVDVTLYNGQVKVYLYN